MSIKRKRAYPETLQTPSVAMFEGNRVAMLMLSREQLITVYRALQRHASVRDPEVDPEGIAFDLAETIRPFTR